MFQLGIESFNIAPSSTPPAACPTLCTSVCCLYLSDCWLCAMELLLLPCLCTHPPQPGLNIVPFHAPLVPLIPNLPFGSLIELAPLEARLLILRKPLLGQCSHWFFVNCLQKWRLFPAFTGSNVLKPDFTESTTWSRCMVCRAAGTDMDFVFIRSISNVHLVCFW